MLFLFVAFIILFFFISILWGCSLWMNINEKYPLSQYPTSHIFLKSLIIFVFFPALIFLTLVLIASIADKKST